MLFKKKAFNLSTSFINEFFWISSPNSNILGASRHRVFLFYCLIKHFFRRFQTLILFDQTLVLVFDFPKTITQKNKKTMQHFCPSDQRSNFVFGWLWRSLYLQDSGLIFALKRLTFISYQKFSQYIFFEIISL